MNYPWAEKTPRLFTLGSAHTEITIAVLIMPLLLDETVKKTVWIVHRDTHQECMQVRSRVLAY